MTIYKTTSASFDIRETDNGAWNVIHMPNLEQVSIGTGRYVGCFKTEEDAQTYCNNWRPPE